MEKRSCDIMLDYQNPIPNPPIAPNQMQSQAASNDGTTVSFWKDIWYRNIVENKERIGSFAENGIHKLHDIWKWKPAIIIGSGPSLKRDAEKLLHNPGLPVISCLHNFAYLTDLGVKVDYWTTLDAGEVVIDEMFHGGKKDKQFYIDASKSQTLLCYLATNPRLFKNWQGNTIWFNSVMPDPAINEKYEAVEPYRVIVSGGGNVLGASFYIAKGIFGANPIIFLGADFSFGYEQQFHAWKSDYDTLGHSIKVTDIYGMPVHTWQSYHNFKHWFDCKALTVPGIYINCTSGGTFGAYPQGNLKQILYMPIEQALEMYRVSSKIKHVMEDPQKADPIVLF